MFVFIYVNTNFWFVNNYSYLSIKGLISKGARSTHQEHQKRINYGPSPRQRERVIP